MSLAKDLNQMILPNEWGVIEDLIPLLKLFLVIIKHSNEKYPTFAMAIPLVRGICINIEILLISLFKSFF